MTTYVFKPSQKPEDPTCLVDRALVFETTPAFKEHAEAFYRRLSLISTNSDSAWIKEYFVNRLGSDWPHIKRADDAMDGLISQVMSIVAANPRLPNWWRSYSVALTNGNPVSAIECCRDVLQSPDVKDFANVETVPFTVS